MLRQNEGTLDRALRVTGGAALLFIALFALGGAGGSILGIVLAAFGFWLLVTGATGVCPGYIPFKFSTLKRKPKPATYAAAH